MNPAAIKSGESDSVIKTIKSIWSDELAAKWEPSYIINMDEWLDSYCVVKKWRERSYKSWLYYCSAYGPHAFHTRGASPCKIPDASMRFSVTLSGFDSFASEGDILYMMSAIIGDGDVAGITFKRHPSENSTIAVVEYLSEKDRQKALDWSKRISIGGTIITIS